MKMMFVKFFILMSAMTLILWCSNIMAYDDQVTHKAIAKRAVDYSSINAYFINVLNFPKGIDEKLPFDTGMAVRLWLEEGSKLEDTPLCRATNHFHNPLRSWDRAGISTISWPLCPSWDVTSYSTRHSALTWATGYDNYTGPIVSRNNQQMGWDKARGSFYSGLISDNNAAREDYFAKTFQSVGQVMHLLQDMAVPAHVRNDFWYSHVWTGGSNPYELYVKNHNDMITNMTKAQIASVMPEFTSPRQTDFWDTTDGSVDIPVQISDPTLRLKSGLAEYTNANFVSEGTLFSNPSNPSGFEYPTKSAALLVHTVSDPFNPSAAVKRPYYYKPQDSPDWEVGYRLAGVNYTYFYDPDSGSIAPDKIIPPLDDYVHRDYAEKLLPRAVGYSAALLNYFFRGSIEIGLPDDGVYAITGPDGTFTKIKLKARNSTANDEAMTNGTIELVVKYKTALTDPFQMHNDCTEKTDYYSYIIVPEASNLTSLPTTSTTLTFDLTGNAIPLWATDVYLQIVYKGQLGNEANAVAVGFKDISEPTPLDLRNDMDWVCINGTNYPTGSAEANAAFIAALGSVPPLPPQSVLNDYLAFTQIDEPRVVTPTYYHAYFVSIDPGYYGRIYVLGDNDAFWFSNQRNSLPATGYYGMFSLINQDETIDGIEYCNYSTFSTQRGLTVWDWHYIALPAYPSSSVCPPINGPLKEQVPVPVTIHQLQ